MVKSRMFTVQPRIAAVTALAMFLTPLAQVAGARAQTAPPATQAKPAQTTPAQGTPAKPATTATTAAAASGLRPDDPLLVWPKSYITKANAAMIMYKPQVVSWEKQAKLEVLGAVAYTPKGGKKEMGTIRAQATTKVAVNERLVAMSPFSITEAHFPSLSKDQLQDVTTQITASLSQNERILDLDFVLASVDKSSVKPNNTLGLKADPPKILFSKKPALIVNLDGEPIWSPIESNDLKYAVNTNWDLFSHEPTKTFYLLNDGVWLKSTKLDGLWTAAGELPASFNKLPANDNWKEVKKALPGKKAGANTPTVFTSTTPTELILLTGEPVYEAVTGTSLMWVSNAADADVFRVGKTGLVYFLVSGRWFSAPDFNGPWTFATPTLPADFAKIPLEHERSRVLASVPGTDQANEAIMIAQVPQTARVSKKLAAPEVAYQGDPKFVPVEPTKVQRAVNTDKDILKVGDLYYMCFDGVWFMARAATGPWTVANTVPKEIYEIPPSSPVYNVTYVTVVEDDNDEVEFATALAFTGMMVAWGCVVWGSGYYYPPYWGYGGGYPYYYGHYPSYGYGARYNPWTGAYSRGVVAYGPYGGAGMGARYNPRTGTYSRGAVAYGPYGARGAASAYNPRTGTAAATRQGSNVYGSWGATGVSRGDDWAGTARVTNNRGTTTRATAGSGGGEAITRTGPNGSGGVARTGAGDVYAGRDGNVYQKGEGGWEQVRGDGVAGPKTGQAGTRDVGTGTNRTGTAGNNSAGTKAGVQPWGGDAATKSQLDRDARARSEGAQRSRDLGSVRSGSTSSGRTGSYRPSGGASRGGGRIR